MKTMTDYSEEHGLPVLVQYFVGPDGPKEMAIFVEDLSEARDFVQMSLRFAVKTSGGDNGAAAAATVVQLDVAADQLIALEPSITDDTGRGALYVIARDLIGQRSRCDALSPVEGDDRGPTNAVVPFPNRLTEVRSA